jgi:hypothetical protein
MPVGTTGVLNAAYPTVHAATESLVFAGNFPSGTIPPHVCDIDRHR